MRHDRRSLSHYLLSLAIGLSLVACSRDRTITHGADGSPEWDRRVRAAVPLGTPLEEARAIMERNGFQCQPDSDNTSVLHCDKTYGGTMTPVRRKWKASFSAPDGRVAEVKSSTGLHEK